MDVRKEPVRYCCKQCRTIETIEELCDTVPHDSTVARRQHVTTAFYLDFREKAESTPCHHGSFAVANSSLPAPQGVGSRATIPDEGQVLANRGLNTVPTP